MYHMPCYQMNLVSVEFKGKSIEVFKKMGAQIDGTKIYMSGVEIDLVTGQAKTTGYDGQEKINIVKRKYSETVVDMIAKKQMWQSKKVGQKITLTKW